MIAKRTAFGGNIKAVFVVIIGDKVAISSYFIARLRAFILRADIMCNRRLGGSMAPDGWVYLYNRAGRKVLMLSIWSDEA